MAIPDAVLDEALDVVLEDDAETVHVDPETGTVTTDLPDGGKVVDLRNRPVSQEEKEGTDFHANLANDIDPLRLTMIANELYDAIEADDNSRQQYLATVAKGYGLLGLKIEEPSSNIGESSSTAEGTPAVTNPLLLDAVINAWANAQAELLPASGPVKIRDDGDETQADDDLAEALERGVNHYLTRVATEYYPDTSHMLFWGTCFGGSGIKKVYRCPIRRRPVSESVDVKNLIVSDTSKDFRSCSRITHESLMRPSVMRRMKFLDAYRDVDLTQPAPMPNAVDAKIAGIQGTTAPQNQQRQEDQPYTIWESQCELDLPEGFEHKSMRGSKLKNKELALPYLVTMDKDSREILSIRRDWNEDDPDCNRARMYLKYPYLPGPGFYGTGLLHVLGNASQAMTAAWREALAAGMYASFPGGLIAKGASRQNTVNFRVAPGQFEPVDTGSSPISQVVMPLPYRDVTPGLMAMMDKITEQTKAAGSRADIPISEGVQNVPVGTMLTAVEQATKVMSATHKSMVFAQGEEIEMLLELFRRHPEDFILGDGSAPDDYWTQDRLLTALRNTKLVPCADPNTPSHIHRVAKALALVQLIGIPVFTPIMDPTETLKRVFKVIREDINGILVPAPPQGQQPPDPAAMAKVMDAQTKQNKLQLDAAKLRQEQQITAAKLAGERDIQSTELAKEMVIHSDDQARQERADVRATALQQRQQASEASAQARQHNLEAASEAHAQRMAEREHALETVKAQHDAAKAQHDAMISEHEATKPEPAPKGGGNG